MALLLLEEKAMLKTDVVMHYVHRTLKFTAVRACRPPPPPPPLAQTLTPLPRGQDFYR
jgi:hypothetical protein